jgi:hypothetical protein
MNYEPITMILCIGTYELQAARFDRGGGSPCFPKALFGYSHPVRDRAPIPVWQLGSDSHGFNPDLFSPCVQLNPAGTLPRSIPLKSPSFSQGRKTRPSSRGTNPQSTQDDEDAPPSRVSDTVGSGGGMGHDGGRRDGSSGTDLAHQICLLLPVPSPFQPAAEFGGAREIDQKTHLYDSSAAPVRLHLRRSLQLRFLRTGKRLLLLP